MTKQNPWERWYHLPRWERLSKHQRQIEPLCRLCLQRGIVTPATVADHIEPHGGDINKFWLGKLQSLCAQCHSGTKRGIERRGYDIAVGIDGWPLDPRHPVYSM